ncbi:MAG: Mut7-C RNAse domain-containing protein [Nitrospirota bacterium]|nr:Mut7-C RNAse domain-containing protein [Nitrospirota bacterium]
MQSLNAQIVPPPMFFADSMLGRLVRWLRALGYDTAYEKIISDEALIERVLTEQRWLLTRDRYLVQRKILRDRHTLIGSDHLQDQLRQLRSELHIELVLSDRTASRCAACNDLLIVIPHEEAALTVPAYVANVHPRFVQCPNCGRIYWQGTHWTNMLTSLQELRAS